MASTFVPGVGWVVEPDIVDERKEMQQLSSAQIEAINARIAAGSKDFPVGTRVVRSDDGLIMVVQGLGSAALFKPAEVDASAALAEVQALVDAGADEVSSLVAEATTAKGGAQAAQTAAEAARDAALIQAGVYATEALGRAAVADGVAFKVQGSGDAAAFEYRRTDSTTSVLIATYPSAAFVTSVDTSAKLSAAALGYEPSDFGTVVIGSVPTATLSLAGSAGASFWARNTPTAVDTRLTGYSCRMAAAGNVQLLLVSASNIVLFDQTLACAIGVNTFVLNSIPIPAGARAFVKPVSGAINYVTGTDVNFPSASYDGVIGDTVTAPTATAAALCSEFTFSTFARTVKIALDETVSRDAAINASITLRDTFSGYGPADFVSTETLGSTPTSATGLPGSATANFWGRPSGVSRRGQLTSLSARMLEVTNLQVLLVEKGVVVYDRTFACAVGMNTFAIADAPMVGGGAQVLARPISGRIAYVTGSGTVVQQSSYSGTVGSSIGAAVAQTVELCYSTVFTLANGVVKTTLADHETRVSTLEAAVATGFDAAAVGTGEKIIGASAVATGMSVAVTGKLYRNAVISTFAGTTVLTATTGSDVRYDVVYFDAVAGTLGAQVGTPRVNDPSEFIPAMTVPNRLPVFNCRVTTSAVTLVPVWDVENGEARSLSAVLEQGRRRSRACIPKTLAKLRKGASVRIVSLGDSIMALQNGAPSTATPDGPVRDLVTYFADNIGADLYNALPKYTAVQMGHADDGVGATHVKASAVWRAVDTLVAAGHTITYNNFSIAARNTTHLVDGSLAPTAWLSAAVALGADVVVLGMGMNELQNSLTETRMVAIINLFKAAGTEVIVTGVARPLNSTVPAWEFTNQALERAAKFTRSAFVPMAPIYDDRFLGVIGCTAADICASNKINHPGINELTKMGEQLSKLLMA